MQCRVSKSNIQEYIPCQGTNLSQSRQEKDLVFKNFSSSMNNCTPTYNNKANYPIHGIGRNGMENVDYSKLSPLHPTTLCVLTSQMMSPQGQYTGSVVFSLHRPQVNKSLNVRLLPRLSIPAIFSYVRLRTMC